MVTATKRKLEKPVMNSFHDFDTVDTITGVVKEYREITTKFGPGMIIDLANTKTGEVVSVMETAGLKGYPWGEMRGTEVEIKTNGYQKGKNGIFRDFEVYVVEVPIK